MHKNNPHLHNTGLSNACSVRPIQQPQQGCHAPSIRHATAMRCPLKPMVLMVSALFAQVWCIPPLYAQEDNSALPAGTAISSVNSPTPVKGESQQENALEYGQAVTLPSVASQYGVSRKTLLAAEASDANPQGVSDAAKANAKTLSKDKGSNNLPIEVELNKIKVRAKRFHEVGPLPGLGLTKEEIPGNVQSITAKEIKESHSLSLTDLMNKKLQSVNVNDYQGNPFMMDVTYRGFTAGPQIGTPQGLSVFFDGIRVNEPFGDVVNWDLIPMNALSSVDVFPGSNPIFGLGTLGGAFTVKTKDGFNNEGVDAEILTGSYERKQLQVSGGTNNGTFALFGAGNFFLEDGWRDNSPSKVNQFFGKASYRGEKLDLNFSTLLVGTDLVGNGLLPSEQYKQDRRSVFTAPDTTKNKLIQFQLSGAFQVNDNFNITGQIYNRKSDRKSVGADVYTRFSEGEAIAAKKNLDAGDEYTCLFASTNKVGIADYYLVEEPSNINDIVAAVQANDTANPLYQTYQTNNQVKWLVDYYKNYDGVSSVSTALIENTLNKDLTDENFVKYIQQSDVFYKNPRATALFNKNANAPEPDTFADGTEKYFYGLQITHIDNLPNALNIYSGDFTYFRTDNGDGTYNTHRLFTKRALNAGKCLAARTKTDALGNAYYQGDGYGGFVDAPVIDTPNGSRALPRVVDGAFDRYGAGTAVAGVPTAVVTENEINQLVKGGAVQLNWNLDHHKFMVGASIDAASADYSNTQQLGFIDAQRNVYLDPAQALDVYALANGTKIPNNNFDGTSVTKSIYASETWTPVETLHVTGAVRYNDTKVKNTIAERSAFVASASDLHKFTSDADDFNFCPAANISADGKSCTGVATGYKLPDVSKLLNPAETEKFSYYSLNPSVGATWQATPNLNIFGNVAQGTRTPSVVELGCAINKKPTPETVQAYKDLGKPLYNTDGSPNFLYPSLQENRSCSLPSTLSGDPYLPQIKATTFDIGLRGTLASALGMDNIEWNLGVYRTDLKDDIYMVSFGPGQDFFDTIGKTRRQGLEAGFGGNYGKAHFKLNYAYTNATFEDTFKMASEDNSSAVTVFDPTSGAEAFRQITVKPGDRMPGVPLHNLNATVSYDLTPQWNIGLTAVAHSESFLRGNENNEHKVGVSRVVGYQICDPTTGVCDNFTATRLPTSNPGKVPGYATFNFQTSYKFNNEWTASMLVNNLFDKEYFSAGRLGRNPFSPHIQDTSYDPSGFNHNSNDWLSTNFIAPSAPRGVWFTLNWQFDPKK